MKRFLTTTIPLVAGALWFGMQVTPAQAINISLTDSWIATGTGGEPLFTNTSGSTGGWRAPTLETTTNTYYASNYPTIALGDTQKVPIMGGCTASCQTATLSDTQNLTVGGPAASGILFVAAPSNTSGNISEGDLKFSLTLSDGVGPATTVYAYMEYYANVATGLDDMQWSGGAVATPAYVDLAHGTNYTQLVSLSDNRKIAVTFNYENDWNMAQTVSFQAVPEPTTIALLGFGLLGTLAVARRRRA